MSYKYLKYLKKIHFLLPVFVFSISAAVLLVHAFAAGGATIYTTPNKNNLEKNQTVSVNVRINPNGKKISAVEVRLQFDTSKLQYLSQEAGGSAFNNQAASGVSGNVVSIDRFAGGGSYVSNDAYIAKINFKALVDSGNTTLSITAASSAYSIEAGANELTDFGSSTITFVKSPTTTSSPTTSNTTQTTKETDSKPTTDTAENKSTKEEKQASPQPVIAKDIKEEKSERRFRSVVKSVVVEPKHQSAELTVLANIKTKVTVKYGDSVESLNKTIETKGVGPLQVPLTAERLVPGKTYYYQIEVTDSEGAVKGEVMSFKLKGYTLLLLLTDSTGKKLKNFDVTLFSDPQKARTDEEGFVRFADLEPGKHNLVYTIGSVQHNTEVIVDDELYSLENSMSEDIVPEVQARTLQLKTSNNNLLVLAISAALLVSIAIALWYILKRKNGGKGGGNKKHGYSPTSFDKDADSSKRINELPSQIFTPDSVEIDSKKLTISELEKKVGKI